MKIIHNQPKVFPEINDDLLPDELWDKVFNQKKKIMEEKDAKRKENKVEDDDNEDAHSTSSSTINSTDYYQKKKEIEEKKLRKKKSDIYNDMVQEIVQEIMPDDEEVYEGGNFGFEWKVDSNSNLGSVIDFCMQYWGYKLPTLHEAVLTGDIKDVDKVLVNLFVGENKKPELINAFDSSGRTALSIAAALDHYEIVEKLLVYKALPDVPNLGISEENNNQDDEEKESHPQENKSVKKNPSNIPHLTSPSIAGRTPLFFSIINRHKRISKLLINSGASVNISDSHCITPLMIAAACGDLGHCKLLVSNNAELDSQDSRGWTALHYAACFGAFKCLNFLLHEGADKDLKDIFNRKPIKIAKFRGHEECCNLLNSRIEIKLA